MLRLLILTVLMYGTSSQLLCGDSVGCQPDIPGGWSVTGCLSGRCDRKLPWGDEGVVDSVYTMSNIYTGSNVNPLVYNGETWASNSTHSQITIQRVDYDYTDPNPAIYFGACNRNVICGGIPAPLSGVYVSDRTIGRCFNLNRDTEWALGGRAYPIQCVDSTTLMLLVGESPIATILSGGSPRYMIITSTADRYAKLIPSSLSSITPGAMPASMCGLVDVRAPTSPYTPNARYAVQLTPSRVVFKTPRYSPTYIRISYDGDGIASVKYLQPDFGFRAGVSTLRVCKHEVETSTGVVYQFVCNPSSARYACLTPGGGYRGAYLTGRTTSDSEFRWYCRMYIHKCPNSIYSIVYYPTAWTGSDIVAVRHFEAPANSVYTLIGEYQPDLQAARGLGTPAELCGKRQYRLRVQLSTTSTGFNLQTSDYP